MTTAPVLAVVYPASSRGNAAAGPDGFHGSAARQMDELMTARIVRGPLPNPVRPVAIIACYPRKPAPPEGDADPVTPLPQPGRPAMGFGTRAHRPQGPRRIISAPSRRR